MKKKYCKICATPMILQTMTDRDTEYGRHECKPCKYKERWRPIITRSEDEK